MDISIIPFEPFTCSKYNFTNLTGRRFHQLLVLGAYNKTYRKKVWWLCKCSCGNIAVLSTGSLNSPHTKACGCINKTQTPLRNITHGESTNGSKTPEYSAFHSAKSRCNNPSHAKYATYGKRGIQFCFESFDKFLAEVGRKPSPDHSLDRFPDNDGNYEKGNLRWATRSEQQRNRRVNRHITVNNETKCLIEWAEASGLPEHTIDARLSAGWCPSCAITIPKQMSSCPHMKH